MMKHFLMPTIRFVLLFSVVLVFAERVNAQVDEICAGTGSIPSLDSPFAHVPYVYGKITLRGFDPNAKFPKVTVTLVENQQAVQRWTVEKSGNYCFKRKGGGGTLTVEVDGVEAAQRGFTAFGSAQLREDFEIYAPQSQKTVSPGVVSAKFAHPVNPNTIELYRKTVEAETNKNPKQAIGHLKEIVAVDPSDFIAWAKLGALYFADDSLAEAEKAFRKSLELKVEYTPAWINFGKIRVAQKQYEAAIEIFKHAAAIDPKSADAFQSLGEAYLLARQGTLGAQALNEALRLDPVGMAEIHLQLAHLYELAGAKHLATREYKLFLTKKPDHPDKKKFEKFIKENPEK